MCVRDIQCRFYFGIVLAALILLMGSSVVQAQAVQQHSTVAWKVLLGQLQQRLTGLPSEGEAVDAWRNDAEDLRSSVAAYVYSHSEVRVQIPEPLPEHPSHGALVEQMDALKTVVDQVIQQSPGTPFNLGTVLTVTVTAPAWPPSPVADTMDKAEIEDQELTRASQAFDYLPGVDIQHISMNRNEAGIMLRGFSTRGQVPFYLDGIL